MHQEQQQARLRLRAAVRTRHPQRLRWRMVAAAAASAFAQQAFASGEQTLQRIVITGTAQGTQVGVADSANVGTVSQKQLEARTVYRPGELLESTPGLIVSQHSGEGKANQFYLRGFNLDHGTDLRTTVDGMLVNQRSHGHGQGWTDLNFLIPELATGLRYKKGPYYASEGDFSSAGAVEVTYANELPQGIVNLGFGQNGYRRVLLADSPTFGSGKLLYALEALRNDGPFTRPDDYRKLNGVLRYAEGDKANGWNVTAMAYKAKWNATDQIPLRAVQSGQLGRFDLIDPTDGGEASRYSLSGAWRRSTAGGATEVNAYVARWGLDLYSNFTYFLDNAVDGDQFNQPDNRTMTAVNAHHVWSTNWFGREGENDVGVQLQSDRIRNGLLNTKARQTLSTTRRDRIIESSLGVWFQNATPWTKTFRTVVGLRADTFRFKVSSDLGANSGSANDSILTPKLNFIFGPFDSTELYVNLGSGFHSNDARGTVITTDPNTSDPVDKVTPLVRSKGHEFGVRTSFIPGLQTSLTMYRLDFASELLFVGDAGTTEAGRPSRRTGFELANFYKLSDWLTIDADIAFARARFRDSAAEGNRIPGAVEGVASVAVAVDNLGPWFGAVQLRYFGPRPLLEDNSVRSNSSATMNARVGYKITPKITVELDVFNLTN
ncbi:MAG: TonB-dependent receptor, partial [Ilumatobacteraceae bacterium]|nr:TonB-dependent receptor [Ilumatobacteraceae bacterium]